jgi:hypothetical protein
MFFDEVFRCEIAGPQFKLFFSVMDCARLCYGKKSYLSLKKTPDFFSPKRPIESLWPTLAFLERYFPILGVTATIVKL